jgi:thiosulfate/3-mercaptopyruvate sulfurtransferase
MDISPIVSPEWLAANLAAPEIRAVDVRSPQLYMLGHIPGAVNLPVIYLSDPTGDPPPPELFARLSSALGLHLEDTIVAVDDGTSPSAARFIWVLHYYGHECAMLMDGGMRRWTAEGWPVSQESVRPEASNYPLPSPDPDLIAHCDDIYMAVNDPNTVILDVRAPEEYNGIEVNAARGGHIPGAVNVNWINNVEMGPSNGLRWCAPEELRALYSEMGIAQDKEVIIYCQSGGRAAASYIALKAAGFPRVRVYSRGWSEWGDALDTEVEL